MTAAPASPNLRPMSPGERFAVLARDNFTCTYCGQSAPDVQLQVDHITPRILGGSNDPENLTTSCAPCNLGKASLPIQLHAAETAPIDARAAVWAEAMEVAARKLANPVLMSQWFRDEWDRYHTDDGNPLPLPDDYRARVRGLCGFGLSQALIRDCIESAMAGKTVKMYGSHFNAFEGLAWRRIREVRRRTITALEGTE